MPMMVEVEVNYQFSEILRLVKLIKDHTGWGKGVSTNNRAKIRLEKLIKIGIAGRDEKIDFYSEKCQLTLYHILLTIQEKLILIRQINILKIYYLN